MAIKFRHLLTPRSRVYCRRALSLGHTPSFFVVCTVSDYSRQSCWIQIQAGHVDRGKLIEFFGDDWGKKGICGSHLVTICDFQRHYTCVDDKQVERSLRNIFIMTLAVVHTFMKSRQLSASIWIRSNAFVGNKTTPYNFSHTAFCLYTRMNLTAFCTFLIAISASQCPLLICAVLVCPPRWLL